MRGRKVVNFILCANPVVKEGLASPLLKLFITLSRTKYLCLVAVRIIEVWLYLKFNSLFYVILEVCFAISLNFLDVLRGKFILRRRTEKEILEKLRLNCVFQDQRPKHIKGFSGYNKLLFPGTKTSISSSG